MAVKTTLLKGWLPCLVLRRFTGLFFHPPSWSRRHAWSINARSRFSDGNAPTWSCFSTTSRSCQIPLRRRRCSSIPTRYASGGSAGPQATLSWKTTLGGGASPFFPPRDEAMVQAVAGEALSRHQWPLSRLSLADLTTQACDALGKPMSRHTVRRILDTAAITPWRYA